MNEWGFISQERLVWFGKSATSFKFKSRHGYVRDERLVFSNPPLIIAGRCSAFKEPMTERIILSIVAILMLALSFKKGDKHATLLTSGLTVGILITWTGVPIVITVGLIIYILTSLLISLTNLRSKELTKFNQTTIVVTGVFAFGANLFSIMHWPYAGEIRLSMIIPIILYIISLVIGMIRRKESGYLTIMNVEFILRLIR